MVNRRQIGLSIAVYHPSNLQIVHTKDDRSSGYLITPDMGQTDWRAVFLVTCPREPTKENTTWYTT